MARMKKETRISKETGILKEQYIDIDAAHKLIADRIIARAAYQKVELEDLEQDLDENGTVVIKELSGGGTSEKRRPAVDVYVSINAQYLRSLKQLDMMLPKDTVNERKDALTDFLGDG